MYILQYCDALGSEKEEQSSLYSVLLQHSQRFCLEHPGLTSILSGKFLAILTIWCQISLSLAFLCAVWTLKFWVWTS